MEVNSFEDLTERLADIWRYCTCDWIRVCDQGSESNQSRWKPKDYWKIIQDSFSLFGQAYGVLRMKTKQVRYDHLFKLLRGFAVSGAAVLSAGHGTHIGVFKLRTDIKAMLNSEDFISDVEKRKGSLSNMVKPETHMTDKLISDGAKIESVDLEITEDHEL